MRRMESPSTAGVAGATAEAALEATAATKIGMRVTDATIRHVRILSLYRCLYQQTITTKGTREATRSLGALPPASWEEHKLHYRIVTSSSCRKRSRQHSQAPTVLG
jgi:hypothetical protein